MADFSRWLLESPLAGNAAVIISDLKDLCAQLYDAASPFAALQDKATNPRVGLTQPVTVAEAEALNAALRAAHELMEKYGD